MAILKAGNFEIEIRFYKYYSCGWIDYSLKPRINSQPLIEPSLNKEWCADGKYICTNVWGKDELIPFFEKIIKTKKDAEWNNFPYGDVSIKAETPQTRRERTKEERKDKKVWVTDFDGELKQQSREEATAFLQPFIDAFFDLHFTFQSIFFEGERDAWEGGKVCVSFFITFDTLEMFLEDLKNEFGIFKLASGYKEEE